tara:strand:+ start:301 stop:798 length:498 start_codon:yes stop_codon:yes gene_type:complete
MTNQYSTKNSFLGLLAFIFRKEKYLNMAVIHGMAVNLKSADIKAAFEAGNYPKQDWRKEALLSEQRHYKQLSKSFYGSLLKTAVLAVIGIVAAYFIGLVDLEMAFSTSKVFVFSGVFLASWGALVQFSPVDESYCKETLCENIHALMAKILFVMGALAAFLGALL